MLSLVGWMSVQWTRCCRRLHLVPRAEALLRAVLGSAARACSNCPGRDSSGWKNMGRGRQNEPTCLHECPCFLYISVAPRLAFNPLHFFPRTLPRDALPHPAAPRDPTSPLAVGSTLTQYFGGPGAGGSPGFAAEGGSGLWGWGGSAFPVQHPGSYRAEGCNARGGRR